MLKRCNLISLRFPRRGQIYTDTHGHVDVLLHYAIGGAWTFHSTPEKRKRRQGETLEIETLEHHSACWKFSFRFEKL